MAATSGIAKGAKDQYANVAYGTVTASAANTLTFAAIQMAVGLFQGVAMVIHRINYTPYVATLRELVAATDSLGLGLTSSNRLANLVDTNDPAIIDCHRIVCVGAPIANMDVPIVHDFCNLPGGGKLIAANPIYFAIQPGGFGAVQGAIVRIDFTFVELADRDYMELIQSQFPANVV